MPLLLLKLKDDKLFHRGFGKFQSFIKFKKKRHKNHKVHRSKIWAISSLSFNPLPFAGLLVIFFIYEDPFHVIL